ncbi:MAG: DegQ family serine endoprotease [Propionivibrio sp.]|nr:DegQ family serine endoprotease [Propionivibrio sp.]
MRLQTLKKSVIVALLTAALTGAYSMVSGTSSWLAHAQAGSSSSSPVLALPDMSGIVARNGQAVVNISTSGKVKNPNVPDVPGLDPNDPFYEFFRHFRIPQQRGERQVRGQGSGFIVRDDGLILTNAHVIEGADEVVVRLNDKREFKAKVLGADKATDVAVLRVEARNLPTVKIGSSANIRVGEWVLAIGSPYGFESSASAGIVSAVSRSLPDDNYVPFIQTDVAVNPGNSGGPLFNMAGEVIGINSQIYSRTGGYQGLSFAIPIDVAVSVQEQIVKYGRVQRGRLGVSIQEVNQSLAESFGLSKPAGALVSSVENDSPAAKAGLEPGDVIMSLNGKEIQSSNELPPLVAAIRPGDNAKMQIWRKGGMREITVKVGGVKEEKAVSAESKETAQNKLGLALRALTPEERRQLDGKGGLLVENVSGAAARAGIRPGDVVLSVNGETVTTVEQLRAQVAKASKRVALLIQRRDAKLFVPIDLG